MGAKKGRFSDQWIDFNFFGHQLTCHLIKNRPSSFTHSNSVDNKKVPIPHFGVILPLSEFSRLADHLKKHNISFHLPPQTRFKESKR